MQQLLEACTSFTFIINFLIVYQYTQHLHGPTLLLQGKAIDIINAFNVIEVVKSTYRDERSKIQQTFHNVYQQAERMAHEVGTEPSIPRLAKRQMHRSNIPAGDTESYYRLEAI